jgi:hydrogenase expression/formation protein HypD
MENDELIKLIKNISKKIDHPINIMEVCGTHTAQIFRYGIKDILPPNIRLISGPGCPVCVTPVKDIDKIIEISTNKDVIISTFGDMIRVPGSKGSLETAKAEGADIRIVYSPFDCIKISRENINKKVIFFSTGFETTVPTVSATLQEAESQGIGNLFIYSVHKLIPPALELLLNDKDINISGFILPGHVSVIIGSAPYKFIPEQYNKPCVITGFGSRDILSAIAMLLFQIKRCESKLEIQYKEVVMEQGNLKAINFINRYFEVKDSYWRGIGVIENSGLKLKREWSHRDAERLFEINVPDNKEPSGCLCGHVLKGIKTPLECPLFGKRCNPEHPVGACMVSSEGSCSVYFKHRQVSDD